jgi:hypothetical protein
MFPFMTRQYFNLWYRLNCSNRYLIWYTDECDGVIVDHDAHVPTFENADTLQTYAQRHRLSVQIMDGILFDLDAIAKWLADPTLPIDCRNFLNAWNLFADVARSAGGAFDSERQSTSSVYDKLFWGSNLAPVTPPGAHYVPEWAAGERRILAATLNSGLSLFRNVVGPV